MIFDQLLTIVPVATVFTAIITIILRNIAERKAKVERTIKLHEGFLNPEFYSKVRAPASQIAIQWMYLGEEIREHYREAVASVWDITYNEERLYDETKEIPKNKGELIDYHFQRSTSKTGLTEHQALTSILRFWTRFNVYRKLGLVNRELAKELFKDEFAYQRDFFQNLSQYVSNNVKHKPRWVDDIDDLCSFFDD